MPTTRRSHRGSPWVLVGAVLALLAPSASVALAATDLPDDNPVAKFYAKTPEAVPAWVGKLPWDRVLCVGDFPGADDDSRAATAIQAVAKVGGGVVYFPAGTYQFQKNLVVGNGVILRGANPQDPVAKNEKYALGTRFEFPKYNYSPQGTGTPLDTAFKNIRLSDPEKVSNCGVVNIAINHGHIYFEEHAEHRTGNNRLVFGCLLTNTAAADPSVPNEKYGHKPHQRFTQRHRAAIGVFAGEGLFVANNRLPKSGDDNFLVKPYTLIKANEKSQMFRLETAAPGTWRFLTLEEGVEFDYDNRPGIYANLFSIGSSPQGDGTPETCPFGFRKGTVIRDNYIYCSGRCAISFSGDGVYSGFNVVRYPQGLVRPTTTGLVASDGSATNDNRAMTMRGYRWVAEGNDYEVHSNMACDKHTKINDGEGLMHEAWVNSPVKDGKMLNNTGNRYLCLWNVAVDGLLIQGNKVSATGAAIHVLAKGKEVRNLRILNNELSAGCIDVSAGKGEQIEIQGNHFTGPGTGVIKVFEAAWVKENTNFTVQAGIPPPAPPKK